MTGTAHELTLGPFKTLLSGSYELATQKWTEIFPFQRPT